MISKSSIKIKKQHQKVFNCNFIIEKMLKYVILVLEVFKLCFVFKQSNSLFSNNVKNPINIIANSCINGYIITIIIPKTCNTP